jgi:hypothetical protein
MFLPTEYDTYNKKTKICCKDLQLAKRLKICIAPQQLGLGPEQSV